MSRTARIRSAVVLAAIAILAGCNDVVAPVVSKIQQVAAKVDNLINCTNSWTTANSGDWSAASNWSAGHAPNADDDACITIEGNYTVYAYGFTQAKSLTLSAPGNVNKPTLQVYGLTYGPGWPPTDAALWVTNNIDNYGTILLTSVNVPNPGGATIRITSTTGVWYNHAGSAFYVREGTGPGRIVTAPIVNDGDVGFDISTTISGAFVNNGHFVVGPAAGVEMHFTDFTQNSDRFENNGSFVVNQAAFTINGGTMSGNDPVLMYSHVTINDPNVATTLYLRGLTTLDGNVGANQVLNVNGLMQPGWPPFDAELKWNTGLNNSGVIRMQSLGSPGEASVKLSAPNNGTIINTGRIETIGAVANARVIAANIDNRPEGTVDIKAYTNLVGAGGTSKNAGLWKLSNTMAISGIITFVQAGGTLDATGGWTQVWGSSVFEMAGGTIIGTPWIATATVRIPTGSTATGSLLLTGEVTLVGDVQAGQKLTIAGYQPGPGWPPQNGQITMPANVTNHGTIVMTAIGDQPGSTILRANSGAKLTNAADGRVDVVTGSAVGARQIFGDFDNAGTLHAELQTFFSTGTIHTSGTVDGGGELRLWYGTTTFATGTIQANILNAGTFHVGQALGAPGMLAVDGWVYFYDGNFNTDIGGTVPGTDFDRMTVTGAATLSATLNVAAVPGKCAGGGQSYEVIAAAPRSGDFLAKNGLNLGGGRTVTTVAGANNYVLNVSGPPCVPPDVTAPVIAPVITDGTPGDNGWYTSDVTVTWNVADGESAVTSSTGCGTSSVTSDTDGITFTCSATSAGGTTTQSVTIKRDATPPVVSTSRAPEANANGWNKTDVTATWSASDGMSGLVGSGTATQLFSTEAANQSASRTFTDRAGNSATVDVTGISIDKTAPWFEERRQPANANGWNNTSVGVTFFFFDNLWVQQPSTYSQVVTTEGAGQHVTTTIVDLAGNTTVATSSAINIDRTAPVVTASRLPAANANGWNNTDVTATWSATDALSGIDGSASATQAFATEGAGQSGSRTFTDLAGNSATADVSGISIDKTAPVVTVTRSPAAGADGWNETNVTATWSATDALSGIAGATSATQVFGVGANQGGSRTFTDLAGNKTTGSITGINVRTPPPPPPPPPTGDNAVGSANPGEIWPPNNKMVAVKITMCTGVSSFTLRSVTNNETGTADVEGWTVGTSDVNGSVRADRDGNGSGRTYTFVYDTVGPTGARGSCTVTVSVPHDQGKKK